MGVGGRMVCDLSTTTSTMAHVEYKQSEKERNIRLYKVLGNASAVHRITGVSRPTINRWAEEAGVKRSQSEIMGDVHDPSTHDDYERVIVLYDAGKLSTTEVEDLTGIPEERVYRWCKREGVLRSKKEAQHLRWRKRGLKRRVQRTCRYVAEHPDKTREEVAEALDIGKRTVHRHLKSPHNPYQRGNGSTTLQPASLS